MVAIEQNLTEQATSSSPRPADAVAAGDYIPVYQPSLAGNERAYVNECLDTNWISSKGRFIPAFEQAFATSTNVKHAVAVSNGTVALHLALAALGVGPDDEVIVPTLTYVASVNAITYVGARPVFCDSLTDTWQMDPEDVARRVTSRTKAILVVHLYGHSVEMNAILEIARRHRLAVVEDCAEAFGSYYQGRHVGGFGDISTFSFFGNKTITCGEGGMVVTNRPDLAEAVVHLKGQGVDPQREYWHDVVGYNYRMTNIAAAIGLAQLERADAICAQKQSLARWYHQALGKLPLELPRAKPDVVHSYWMYSVLAPRAELRDEIRRRLAAEQIETRPFFYPAHYLPMYREDHASYPVAEDLSRRGINLPSWPGLSQSQVERIAAALGRALETTA